MMIHLRVFLTWAAMLGLIVGPLPLSAQSEAPPPAHVYTEQELDDLLAPIALYPDPLLAQIFPAATLPGEIVQAARYVKAGKDPDQIEAQPWDESVKALARYPDVLKMMDQKLDWTTQLGEAFIAQPADVFSAVQRLRAKAQAFGNLQSTPQQVVTTQESVITIMPADPQVIYVPQYQPQVVYVQQPPNLVAPLITFGVGFALGAWVHNEVNWHSNNIYYHNSGWNYHGGPGGYYGGGNTVNINNNYNHTQNNFVNNGNIGNGNGNNGSVWKPQTRPAPPKYGPGNGNGWNNNRPGSGNGNGNRPPGPGNGGNNRPPGWGNGNGGNNRPPGSGGDNGGINRPGSGNGNGNRPPGSGNGGNNRPSGPGNGHGPQKPANRPAQPKPERPTTRPAQDRPSQRPAPGGDRPQGNREGTKQRPANAGNRPEAAKRGGGDRDRGDRGGRGGGRDR